MGWLKVWTLKRSCNQDLFFKYIPLRMRNAEWGLGSEKDRWKVQGPEVVELMAKAGTGWISCLQGSWSSLLEGWEWAELGSVLLCRHPSWQRLQSWAGQVSLALSLCSAHRIPYLHHPRNGGAHLKQWLKCGTSLSHQSRVSGGIRADLILSSHQYWDDCWTGLEMQSHSCSDMLKLDVFSMDLRNL